MLAPVEQVTKEITDHMQEYTQIGAVLDMRESDVEILRERVRELEAINKGLAKQLRELRTQQRQPKRKLAIAR